MTGTVKLTEAQRSTLRAVASYGDLGAFFRGDTRNAVAPIRRLLRRGMIRRTGHRLIATDAGRAALDREGER